MTRDRGYEESPSIHRRTALKLFSDAVSGSSVGHALASGLAARGLSRVDSNGTLLVRYHAAPKTRIDILPLDSGSGAPPSGIRYAQTGAPVVDLLDATSGKVVWRGHAEGVPRYGPKEIAAQIDAAVGDLRGRYPPGH